MYAVFHSYTKPHLCSTFFHSKTFLLKCTTKMGLGIAPPCRMKYSQAIRLRNIGERCVPLLLTNSFSNAINPTDFAKTGFYRSLNFLVVLGECL